MSYLVAQIKDIVNDAVEDALGESAALQELDSSDIVSLGKAISAYDAYEGFFGALANRIVRTIYFIRTYSGSKRNILRDEHEYGAFIQKVYYEMPDAVDNPTWKIPTALGAYTQSSPYDVNTTITVSSLIFGGKGTWSIEIVRPLEQIKSAFLDNASMMNFIDGIYLAVENAFRLEEDRLISLAANTAMAAAIRGGKARNLLAEYNSKHPSATLTTVKALESADFLKYASKEINRTIKNMGKMSTVYNVDGYTTFTPKDRMVVEILAEFASASDMYLQADTFHNELVKLPNYEEVPFWQGSGKAFAFNDCSSIDVTNEALADENDATDEGNVMQTGIICFLHDIENVAAYFGRRRSWELPNPRSEVMIHGEKAEKGFAVDTHANGIVFYMDASETTSLAELTVTSEAGSASGKTKVTVTGYTLATGDKYVYKVDTAATEVIYGADLSAWTEWDGTSDITAATDKVITVAVVNHDDEALASGYATVVAHV